MVQKNSGLTELYLRSILDYDPEAGIFRWKYRADMRPQWNIRYAGKVAGSKGQRGRIEIRIDGKSYLAHRLAWLFMTGHWPENEIDHKDIDPSNNTFSNIREATRRQNAANKKPYPQNTSGYMGVTFSRSSRKWMAMIKIDGKTTYLGVYKNIEDAANAYMEAAEKVHGAFVSHSARQILAAAVAALEGRARRAEAALRKATGGER